MASFTNTIRFTGMSGLDTEGIVTQLMQAHSMRLDKMRQKRDIMKWQQEMYRGVMSNISDIQKRVLSIGTSQPNSILMPGNWSGLASSITNLKPNGTTNGISVNSSSSASAGLHQLKVYSVSKAHILEGFDSQNTGAKGIEFDRTRIDDLSAALADAKTAGKTTVSFNVALDGTSKAIELDIAAVETIITNAGSQPNVADEAEEIATGLASIIDGQLDKLFGNDSSTGNPRRVTMQAVGGSLVLNAGTGHTATMSGGANNEILDAIGFESQNRTTAFVPANISLDSYLGSTDGSLVPFEFNINGVTFERDDFAGDATLQDLIAAINESSAGVKISFNNHNGLFSMAAKEVGTINSIKSLGDNNGNVLNTMFGTDTFVLLDQNPKSQKATDTVIELNGRRYERTSNSFSVEGLDIRLSSDMQFEVDPNDASKTLPNEYEIKLEHNTSKVKDLIKSFIDEYNTLVRDLRGMTESRRPKMSGGGYYMPLTDEERKAMSEREIELWEEQAKTGILRRDDHLTRLTRDMYNWMMQPLELPNGGKLSLLELGIRTSSDLSQYGQLSIDEEKLDAMLETRLEDVQALFTNRPTNTSGMKTSDKMAASGVAERINELFNLATSPSGAPGSLSELAGLATGATAANNSMSKRIEVEERRIDEMIKKLQKKEENYYRMYSKLEAAMMQSNSQMNYLEQMFLGSGQ